MRMCVTLKRTATTATLQQVQKILLVSGKLFTADMKSLYLSMLGDLSLTEGLLTA